MRNHQAGDVPLGDDAFGQLQNLIRRDGIERGGVLVEQQELRRDHRGHQQCERLSLSTGEQADRGFHPVLQPHVQRAELFAEKLAVLSVDAAEQRMLVRRAQIRDGEVLLDGHMRRRALERILKQMADAAAALVVRKEGKIDAVERDKAAVHEKGAGNGVEQRGFARAVGADDRGKFPIGQRETQILNGFLLVDGSGVERFGNVADFKHRQSLPSAGAGARGARRTLPFPA